MRVPSRHADSDTQRERLRSELREEFAHHIELIEHAELTGGATPENARARAMARFGDIDRATRQCERVVLGATIMSSSMRTIGVICWRIAVTLGVCTALLWAYWANQRAIEASNLAFGAAQRAGWPASVVSAPATGADRAAILRSVWGVESGEVEVRGAVRSPGKFRVDVAHPLDLATLVAHAGGPTDGAGSILWRQRGEPCEAFTTLASAERFRDDHNTMPAPGSIITIVK